ncbi:uncharacterized protein LOC117117984 [Anneissia japonica]|uniref:uncharacterized protein LOC117117984 n=1 Tax=Anneissia japonica TaxID=1529436 RepID=UPI001425B2FD|nr:uncharacterized protein LOC117117984 [Anneissia japonica]
MWIRDRICTYRMCVHLFGGTWCPSASTYALRQTSKDNTVDVDDKIRNIVNENFYVDDALISVADEEDGVRIIRDLTSLLSSGGFKLTKWLSNSPTILREVSVGDRATTVKDLDLEGTLPTEKALGIRWDVQNDAFGFNVSVKHVPKTRRGVLSALSSVFDPLGFVAPFTLKGKLIVQQLVRRRVGWDDPAPDDLLSKWELWQNELIHLEELKIRRCLRKDEFGDVVTQDLHHFADASEVGYGVASYLHMKNQHGDTQSTLVFARSRLCPIKRVTIPRLELMAATLAVTTDTFLRKELGLNVGGSYFWTDSMIVLQYIRNDERRFKTFVSNRLATIHNGSSSTQWRHIDGKRNPADLASRGLDAKQLVGNMLWYEGPEFLRRNDTMWPIQPDNSGDTYEDDPELKKDERVCHHIQKEDSAHILNILISRYASWTKLKRTIAWLLRFKSFIVLKKRKGLDKLSCVDLTVGEVQEAELEILKYVQSTHLSSLSALKGLDAYRTDDGLIRVGGRVKLQDKFSYDQKHQIILPSDHDATNLIINYYHLLTGHGGVERVLAETRQKYWIVRGRRNVRRELSKCITCKRIKAPPLQQIMGLLPTSRLAIHEQPFSRVGVDYFGPLTVKRGRTECKRYGCIFSCLTTRAVHIEVTNSLTTDTFINAFHRFIARRGSPQEVISDNGTNFIGAKQEFKKAVKEWNQKTINDFMVQKEIKWSFNPPTASHMGGIWERQIRSIRTIIFSLVRQQTLDDEGVNTLMCIVEGIINSRPLTKLSDDPKDDNPLTPNHLLLLRGGPLLPPGHFVEQDIYRRRWRQIQYLADVFWRRWVKEYLPLLQIRQKWVFEKRDVKVGDLVLVTDKNTPRYQWPLALVVDVYKGSDEHVRSVKIRMRGSTYERPITKLCLLEGVD